MEGEKLNPRELAYLRRLRLFHQPGVMERRFKIMISVAGSIALLLFALSIYGMVNEWPLVRLWLLGFFAGIHEIVVIQVLTSRKRWKIVEPFIDWDRIEAATTPNKK